MEKFCIRLGLLVGLLLAQTGLRAQHHHQNPRHGMVLFGREKFYLSHLPYFTGVHGYQVVFATSLAPETRTTLNRSREDAPHEFLYTFDPEPFDLPAEVASLSSFGGVLYRGHFENGGERLSSENRMSPTKAHAFKKLNPVESPRPAHYQAFLFGSATDLYLVHEITARPNFDQIVRVHPSQWPAELTDIDGLRVAVTGRADSALGVGESLAAAVLATDGRRLPLDLQVVEEIYLDPGELL